MISSVIDNEKEIFRRLTAPISVQWEVTGQCDKNCFHCANYWRDKSQIRKIAESAQRTIYDKTVQEIQENRVFSVVITGGEPLIVYRNLLPYIERLHDANIGISLNSTLTRLTPEIAKELRNLGIKSVLTSVTSFDPETDYKITKNRTSWKHTARGIRTAAEHELRVTANMVVSKRNISQVFETAQYVKSLGVAKFTATKVSKPSNSNNFSDEMLSLTDFQNMMTELLRAKTELNMDVGTIQAYPKCAVKDIEILEKITDFGRSCTGGKTFCMIGYDGFVRSCPLVGDLSGNIMNDGLAYAWDKMQSWRTDAFLPEECKHCRLQITCGGGCKADAKHVNGSYKAPDPYCVFSREPIRKSKKDFDLVIPTQFRFNEKIKMRREQFGGILYLSGSKWVAVGHKVYEIARTHKTTLTQKSFGEAIQEPSHEVVSRYIVLLIKKDILKKV